MATSTMRCPACRGCGEAPGGAKCWLCSGGGEIERGGLCETRSEPAAGLASVDAAPAQRVAVTFDGDALTLEDARGMRLRVRPDGAVLVGRDLSVVATTLGGQGARVIALSPEQCAVLGGYLLTSAQTRGAASGSLALAGAELAKGAAQAAPADELAEARRRLRAAAAGGGAVTRQHERDAERLGREAAGRRGPTCSTCLGLQPCGCDAGRAGGLCAADDGVDCWPADSEVL